MNGNIHRLIVKSAIDMLPAELKYALEKPITEGVYSERSWKDLLIEGSHIEDSKDEPGIIPDPDLQNIPSIAVKDHPHWPWMEHFWNDDLEENKGLIITTEVPVVETVLARFRSALARALQYWNDFVLKQYNEGDRDFAFICLGRVLHLLADVGTPCHVHGDSHTDISFIGYDDDDYEEYTEEEAKKWAGSSGEMMPFDWDVHFENLICYNPDWDLKTYFYKLGEISRLYDSDDVDGSGNGHPYHWNHWNESLGGIVERDPIGDLTDYACNSIAKDLIPISIRFTAGLICHFFKSVNFYIPLDVVDVSIRRLYVYDDNDSMGSGEIYLSASLGGGSLTQIGGEFDIESGHYKDIHGNEMSVAIKDKNTEIHFCAYAYDDDSNWFHKSTESLGYIDYIIDTSKLKSGSSESIRVECRCFALDIEVKFRARAAKTQNFAYIINQYKHRIIQSAKDLEPIMKTRYDIKKDTPIFLNLKTMSCHGLANNVDENGKFTYNSRNCKKWDALAEDMKLKIFMTEEELFEEIDGKTRLLGIVEKIFGENSKQRKMVEKVKCMKGYCSCRGKKLKP